ncbi:hypothetical protein [Polyangium jinanense]|uniref:Uncharacterized protein n=1 Tax=Polyangium jinanense TaxID=2829994 RepID=A0A9X3XDS6_9BACT|nr:hypothetical protein [Polyangium jinanense]MDC3959200.1 hypothetical protein [Polyangium jinanense]MDC3987580.1 hypothetical protein [Polyangium jinanense]MDC3989134.1 hypothetical protein [Polyangium jinanense]
MRSEPQKLGDVPGRALLHPWSYLAAAALAFNVFWLRRKHPGVVSGKLSDLAICFLLPVFLVAAAEWLLTLARLCGGRVGPRVGPRGIWLSCGVSVAYFVLLKTWPAFTGVHRALLGVLDTPFGGGRSFRNLADPTDLVALVMVPLSAWHLVRVAEREDV